MYDIYWYTITNDCFVATSKEIKVNKYTILVQEIETRIVLVSIQIYTYICYSQHSSVFVLLTFIAKRRYTHLYYTFWKTK